MSFFPEEPRFFGGLLFVFFLLPLVVLPVLLFVSAPYGRHARAGWGPKIGATFGWVLMEAPSPVIFAICAFLGADRLGAPTLCFAAMWEFHYIHRSFIFPFRRRGGQQDMPLAIAGNAILFNTINSYLNGRNLFHFAAPYPTSWLWDPRFLVGAVLFCAGLYINLQSDAILRNLRAPGETGYKIPRGGFYKFISSPNYFGEIIEWTGWAIATWSLPGLAFAIWTTANLLPRAITNHKWCLEKFADYPRERRAVIPFLF